MANYNAYQVAQGTKNQAIANAQATLDQANTSLTALVAAARPEDVATAQAQMDNASGAVQIAQAAFQNTIITAPSDGTVVSVAIAPGQIATPNSPAIEFTSIMLRRIKNMEEQYSKQKTNFQKTLDAQLDFFCRYFYFTGSIFILAIGKKYRFY